MMTTTSSSSALAAAKGVLYSILLRLLSFFLSQLTIRLIDDPRTLGNSSIKLELLCSSTVLFLSREGFRLSLVRISTAETGEGESKDRDAERSKLTNVAWLTIPLGIFLTIISLLIHIHQCNKFQYNEGNDEAPGGLSKDDHDYKIAGLYYCLATVIEIISEPCMIHCLQTLNIETRAKAEGIASIAKAFTSVVILSYLQGGGKEKRLSFVGPISSFGIAQIVYASTLTLTLFFKTRASIPSLKLPASISFHREALSLSIIFTIQSIFKHLLTEGDRIILSSLVSSYNSGIYAMVSSYGSIVSRMILLPLEENGRLLFSHYHSRIVSASISIAGDQNHAKDKNDERKQEVISILQQLETTYVVLVKLVLYVGLFFISFGTNYTTIFLQILAGSKWANNQQASHTLSVYCSYILCMALNGMTEAFVYGVVDDKVGVGLLTVVHGLVGFLFYILAPWLVIGQGNGTIGLIVANEICMLLRSIYSLDYAATYFMRKNNRNTTSNKGMCQSEGVGFLELRCLSLSVITKKFNSFYQLTLKVLPSGPVLFFFVLSYKVTQRSKLHFLDGPVALASVETGIHLGIGISLLFITFIMIWKFDRSFLQSLKSFIKPDRKKRKKE